MKVIITDHGFSTVDRETAIIEGAGHVLVVEQCRTEADLLEKVCEADALIVQWAPITAHVIENLARCRIIVRYGIGVDNVDIAAAGLRNIPVCNVPDYCIDEVADHSIAMAISRQLYETYKMVLTGKWSIVPPNPIRSLSSMVFATAGFGRIAREVMTRARPFGFKLVAFDPYVDSKLMAEYGVEKVSKDDLFRIADILSLHLPLTPETKHFVSASSLDRMKDDAIVVNTSRGGLIDTRALASALQRGKLSGAGIDVYEIEPLENGHPLRDCDRVILTSHTAWNSLQSVPRLQTLAAEEVVRALAGQALANPVYVP